MTARPLRLWLRDARRLARLAKEVQEQAAHFERHAAEGADDTIRSLFDRRWDR